MTDKEIILSRTSGGYDVFLHYFGDVISKKMFLNTYRSDSHPSCNLRLQNDRYYMHDFGSTEWSGDCFTLVSMIYNLNPVTQFGEILRRIDRDLNLFVLDNKEYRIRDYAPNVQQYRHIQNSEPPKYSATLKEFTPAELSYWTKYGIDRKTLDHYNVKSVLRCFFQKEDSKKYTVYGTAQTPAFAYVFEKGIKIYRPNSGGRFLYGGHLPKPYIFGFEQLPEKGDILIVTGGEKDVLSLASHGFNAICFNSETAKVSEEAIRKFSSRFNAIIFLYDVDDTGIRESQLRVEEMRKVGLSSVYRYQLPLKGTKEEKDISDYFRVGRSAEELRNQINKVIAG